PRLLPAALRPIASLLLPLFLLFLFPDPSSPVIYPLSLHDALPICAVPLWHGPDGQVPGAAGRQPAAEDPCPPDRKPLQRISAGRSEEHTSELQSRFDLVCRLLLEKKNHWR